jgi:hypothetical protein
VASYADERAGYRMWAARTGRINPSMEDRYDHDLDWPLDDQRGVFLRTFSQKAHSLEERGRRG